MYGFKGISHKLCPPHSSVQAWPLGQGAGLPLASVGMGKSQNRTFNSICLNIERL